MKKLIALLLSLMMMAGMCSAFAEGDLVLISAKDPLPVDAAVQEVTLRIEGAAKNLYYKTVALQENDTVLTLLERALTEAKLTYTVTDSPYGGKYLSELAGEKEAAFGGYDGWMYAVNGEMPMDTIDAHALKAGDSVLLYFGDMSILQPIVTVVRSEAAVALKVEADVTTYDEQWNPTTTRQPIAQAKLTVDGADYTTDEAGQVTLSAETSAKDAVSFQIAKSTEAGLTQVVRFAPDYQLQLKAEEKPLTFSDVTEDDWYYTAVMAMAEKKAVNGYSDGAFRPNNNISRAEVAVILYRLAGSPETETAASFFDVKAEDWCAKEVAWAAKEGIVNGKGDGKFDPNANITRQDLALMLSRFVEKILKKTLPAAAEAPAFADNAAIGAYASEAVYQLQKAGIVSGIDGRFLPLECASRAVTCQMLDKLLKAAA